MHGEIQSTLVSTSGGGMKLDSNEVTQKKNLRLLFNVFLNSNLLSFLRLRSMRYCKNLLNLSGALLCGKGSKLWPK